MIIGHKQIKSINGVVHYWINRNINKDAKCIVFTHGLTANHSMFEKQVEYFKTKYSVITWDVPLHGLSRPYNDFSYNKAAIELKTILDKERMKKVILIGMSMGGYPSQEFASLYPDMVEGFIALDTTPFGMKYYSKSDLWWLKQVAPLAKWFPDGMLRKSMAKSVSKTEYSYKKMMEMLSPLSKMQIIEQMDIAYGEFAKENKDVNFTFPVLLLLGDSDTTGKVKLYNEEWSKITGYPLHLIRNAAHFSNGDNPDQVNMEIEAFIESL
jgi:pimeloyl-ACP methyl ester carboxylesterase